MAIDRSVGRWRLARDDSGHNYLIPADKLAEFDNWLGAHELLDVDLIEALPDYDDYRIDGFEWVTFTDPREDD